MDGTKNKKRTPLSHLLSYSKNSRPILAASILCALLGVIAGIIPYYWGAQILIEIVDKTLTMSTLVKLCLFSLLAYAFYTAALIISTLLSHHLAYGTLENLRGALADKLTRIPLGRVINTPSGTLKKIFVEDIQQSEIAIAHMIPELTSNILGPFLVLIYLFINDWRLAIAVLIPMVLGIIFMCGTFYKYKERFGQFLSTQKEMNSTVVEYVRGISVIKAFGQSSSSYKKYTNSVSNFRVAVITWFKKTQNWEAIAWTIFPSSLLVLLPLGAHLIQSGSLTLPTFLLAACLSLGIAQPLFAAITLADSFAATSVALTESLSWMDEDELIRPVKDVELSAHDYNIRNIDFSYTEDKKIPPALSNVSLVAPDSHFVAFVGPSGSGKTTLSRLMLGFWDPDNGDVMFGSHNLKDIPLNQLVHNVASVAQDTFLYDATIEENLKIARPDATEKELYDALVAAGCEDFLEKLPHGLRTQVGGSGTHLSGGERQRVTLARALLKNSPVVILDEATAYIDPENEGRIQAALARITGGKTLVVIAHRLSTIKAADRIYVFDKGAITESGKHEELLAHNDLYARMWQTHTAARIAAEGNGE